MTIELSSTRVRSTTEGVDLSAADTATLINARQQWCSRTVALSGGLGGMAIGLISVFALMGHPFLPTLIHRAVAVPLFMIIGAVAGAASASVIRNQCCNKKRITSRCARPEFTQQKLHGAVACVFIAAIALLVVPSDHQRDIWTAVALLLGSAPPLPTGYCDPPLPASAANGSKSVWWHQWGGTAEEVTLRFEPSRHAL